VAKRQPPKNKSAIEETSKPERPRFPSARYFQIHFQHMEAQLDLANRNLERLQQQLADLQTLFSSNNELGLSKTKK